MARVGAPLPRGRRRLMAKVISFGYDVSDVPEADKVFDVRDLPHDLGSPEAQARYADIKAQSEGANTIAIGCQKGQHRSVALATRLAEDLHASIAHSNLRTATTRYGTNAQGRLY